MAMIGSIQGKIIELTEKTAIIDVSGVGYLIYTTAYTRNSLKEGENIFLWTYLVVREDTLDLYGFSEKKEKEFFELLITVSGIGPKSAIGILSLVNVDSLHQAIVSGNTQYLTKISGIGKKGAEKIVLELKDKLTKDGFRVNTVMSAELDDVVNALQSLGYSTKEIREVLQKIPTDLTDTNQIIKEALKQLTNH